jgi:hypothetical protein
VLTLNKFLWLKFLKFYRITYSPPPLGALSKVTPTTKAATTSANMQKHGYTVFLFRYITFDWA